MKKINVLIFILLFCMFNVLVVHSETKQVIVDEGNRTATYNEKVYTYKIGENEIKLTNDECVFTKSISSYASSISVNDTDKCYDYINEVFPIFDELETKYNMSMEDIQNKTIKEETKKDKEKNGPVLVLVLLMLIILGLISIIKPTIFWKLEHGLYIKNAKPTKFALNLIRMSGVTMIIISIVLFTIFLGL